MVEQIDTYTTVGILPPPSELLSPDEWCKKLNKRIIDPDGWRGRMYRDWNDLITQAEFEWRLRECTQALVVPSAGPLCGMPDFVEAEVNIAKVAQPEPPPWTLEEGIETARKIEAALIPIGYHCCLGGSVLHKGTSTKDLDIFIYPHNAQQVLLPEEILPKIDEIFPKGMAYGACNPEYEERDSKSVYWSYGENNRRIDFFFVT